MTWIFIAIAARLLPHPANVTPFFALVIFSVWYWPQRFLLGAIFIANIGADMGLASIYHFPWLGSWMWGTYSGLLIVWLLNKRVAFFCQQPFSALKPTVFFSCGLTSLVVSTIFYWLWTNLNVWLFSAMYPRDLQGVLICYWNALPFLRNSVLGDTGWFMVFCLSWAWMGNSRRTRSKRTILC